MASSDLEYYFKEAVEKKASDLLLVADCPPILRIGGSLTELNSEVLSADRVKDTLLSFLNEEQKTRLETVKDLDVAVESIDKSRFRVNIHYQRETLAAAFRPIPTKIPNPKDLNAPDALFDFAREHRGLILVTGATGSGKTTTQAMMIDLINASQKTHIVTVEDPIEFLHKNNKSIIEQREVGQDSPTFSSALKHVLRQNPNVILIGEMRDIETISTAITAAETGHLVISTLHTNDAVQSIDRIVDVFPPYQQNQVRMQLALALQGIISQQLIPRADGNGVVLASEVLRASSSVRNLIRKGNSHEIYSVIETSNKAGMHSMDQSIARLFHDGNISAEMAMARAFNPEYLSRLLESDNRR